MSLLSSFELFVAVEKRAIDSEVSNWQPLVHASIEFCRETVLGVFV